MGEYVNSKQLRFDRSYASCGVVEAHHLPDIPANQTAFSVANFLYHKANGRPASFVMFSDIVGGQKVSRGELLAKELLKVGAGSLMTSDHAVNPRTGNTICVWVLQVDHDKFRKWYTEEYVNRISE